jgi:hypothetical protein
MHWVLHFRAMQKDSRLSFRVRSNLKKTLESIAENEGRSVAQVCEAFLTAGCESYKEEGMKFLQRVFAQSVSKSQRT